MSQDTLDKQLAECFSVPHHPCWGLSSLHGRMDSDVELSTSTRPSPANQELYVHPSPPLDSLWRSPGSGNRMTWVHSPFGLCLTQQRCPPFLLYARSLGSRVMLIGGAEYSRKSSHLYHVGGGLFPFACILSLFSFGEPSLAYFLITLWDS